MPSQSPERTRARSKSPISKETAKAPSKIEPYNRSRSRSRSPRRSPPRRPKNFSGLKWKNNDRDNRDVRDSRDPRDDRGGRDRDHGRRYERDYERDGGRDRGRDRRDDDRGGDRGGDRNRDRDSGRDRNRRGGDERPRDRDYRRGDRERKPKPKTSEKETLKAPPTSANAPASQAYSGEPMIMVTVNDRLGTKAQIPCLASDPVKVFKALVAAKIGRASHEIMLKRQGERPFKDHITLGDYGVSNGVQLDLELDTGD